MGFTTHKHFETIKTLPHLNDVTRLQNNSNIIHEVLTACRPNSESVIVFVFIIYAGHIGTAAFSTIILFVDDFFFGT